MRAKTKIGFMNIADPRLGPEWLTKLYNTGEALAVLLKENGFDVESACCTVVNEHQGAEAALRMRNAGCAGIVVRVAWFNRSNTPVAIAQSSGLPIMLAAFVNPDDTGFEGLALAHGALNEVGIAHHFAYGTPTLEGMKKVLDWARACRAKEAFQGAVYGEIGGRCLEMLPGSSDPNQLRKLFGFHIDPLEQWTLIRRAETIPEDQWRSVAKTWMQKYCSMEVNALTLERSAKLYVAGNQIAAEHHWDFAGIQCQTEMIDNYLAPCLPVAQWNDDGFTVSCETDINNAIGMYLVNAAFGHPAMFCDLYHFDIPQKTLHALNCGTAAASLAGGEQNVRVVEQVPEQGTWDEEKGCSRCKGGACNQFILPPGDVTVLRFGRLDGQYVVQLEEGEAVEHAYDPNGLSGLARAWPFAYVRLNGVNDTDRFIQNMLTHHAVIAKGHCAGVVEMFAQMLKILVLKS